MVSVWVTGILSGYPEFGTITGLGVSFFAAIGRHRSLDKLQGKVF